MFIFSLLALTAVTYACEFVNNACPSPCQLVNFECVSENCQQFTSKLGSSTSNPFYGTVAYVEDKVDLIIKITYIDSTFSDTALKGIVTGENSDSCLKLSLVKYIDSNFLEYETSLYEISYSNDSITNRTYSFVIPSKDFVSSLKPSIDGSTISFTGYYGFKFYQGKELQKALLFSFTANIKTTTTSQIDTSFGSLSTYQVLNDINITLASKLQFCDDAACANPSDTANLYLNDQVWIKHSLTTQGSNYYITNPVIYFTGDKLFKQANIETKNMTHIGYSLYLVTISIAWTNVSISVTGTLSTSPGSRFLGEERRILATAYGAVANTPDIKCVKTSSDTCIQCDTNCDVDNSPITSSADVSESNACPCSSSQALGKLIAFLTLLLIFMN